MQMIQAGQQWMQSIEQRKARKEFQCSLTIKNLQVNKTKTDEYTIKSNGQTDWKRCKYLGSLWDTDDDIKRRKTLAIETYNNLKNILEHESTSMKTKIRILKVYIESIFLYNSELWSLTKTLVKENDIFQRGVIKKIFSVHWQDKITNVELYRRFKILEWRNQRTSNEMVWSSSEIKWKDICQTALKKPRGGQKLTWMKLVEKDLEEHKIPKCEAETLAQDRTAWRNLIFCGMSAHADVNHSWWWWQSV